MNKSQSLVVTILVVLFAPMVIAYITKEPFMFIWCWLALLAFAIIRGI